MNEDHQIVNNIGRYSFFVWTVLTLLGIKILEHDKGVFDVSVMNDGLGLAIFFPEIYKLIVFKSFFLSDISVM